jgi:DNA (cytosine-5)-methyltransferase 1
MSHYYNERDKYCARWLRNLQAEGHIPAGEVDERSIVEILPEEIKHHTQAHFFAGIAGWPLALKMAGWPEDRPVWTGSAPCQPFSSAGKKKGLDDERHLSPKWLDLISRCKPPIIFGEQVADAVGKGWLDALFVGLESQGYSCGAAVLPAVSVGSPHLRHRLFFVADSNNQIWASKPRQPFDQGKGRRVAFPGLAGFTSDARSEELGAFTSGEWGMAEWQLATDGKYRAFEPGTPPMVDGIPAHVGRVCAYGNAIVPQVAAKFIKAFLAAESE